MNRRKLFGWLAGVPAMSLFAKPAQAENTGLYGIYIGADDVHFFDEKTVRDIGLAVLKREIVGRLWYRGGHHFDDSRYAEYAIADRAYMDYLFSVLGKYER